jgi:HD superfamily phosphohydrolase
LKVSKNIYKIINDPVHGFISVPWGFIYDLLRHPYFQRLRYIKQLGLSEYVYPGATHSRFQHSLGALHLMSLALETLRNKGVEISFDEEEAAMAAILLHDIGHGPFSHALEYYLVEGASHEMLSLAVMQRLNREFEGRLDLAISMFTGKYNRAFFHDLISSQIDMDRLDYLVRDTYYSGVVEGSVGSGRIIKMINVKDGRLVVDEKGIYSIEKFLIARRLMYWQVYMHKTVVSAERLLINIIKRAKELLDRGVSLKSSPALNFFLDNKFTDSSLADSVNVSGDLLNKYLEVDDNELLASIRMWKDCDDKILSDLAGRLLSRDLLAIELQNQPFDDKKVDDIADMACKIMNLDRGDVKYYVFSGEVSNRTYAPAAPSVKILSKSGDLKEITELSDMLIHEALSQKITKYFLCYPKEVRNKIIIK